MSTEQLVIVLLIGFAGSLSLLGGLLDWNWFMQSRRAAFFVKILGRTGARVVYIIIGAALLGFAIYGSLHPEALHSRRYGI